MVRLSRLPQSITTNHYHGHCHEPLPRALPRAITTGITTSHYHGITTSHYHDHEAVPRHHEHYRWTRYVARLPCIDHNKLIYINSVVISLVSSSQLCIPVLHSNPVPSISKPAPSLSIPSPISQAPLLLPVPPYNFAKQERTEAVIGVHH